MEHLKRSLRQGKEFYYKKGEHMKSVLLKIVEGTVKTFLPEWRLVKRRNRKSTTTVDTGPGVQGKII